MEEKRIPPYMDYDVRTKETMEEKKTEFEERLDVLMGEIKDINIGKGKPEWGAPEEDVFIIKLGERVC